MCDHPDLPLVRSVSAGRWRGLVAATIVLGVFGAVVAVVSSELRTGWRAQILQREGEVLHTVALMQQTLGVEREERSGIPSVDPALEIALHTSKMRGVLAVRWFDLFGEFRDAVPVEVDEGVLPAADLEVLAAGQPVVHYRRDFPLESLFLDRVDSATSSVLEVNVPLPAAAGDDAVIVQYWINGLPVEREFAQLDARVARQAGIAFLAGALLIGGSLFWAFRRLDRANRELRARAEDLARANRELGQSARTSAIGAITAHLMHGLRNPLAGLEDFVASQEAGTVTAADEWSAARESTQRLRVMINDVHAVIRDVGDSADFEISAGEMCAGLCERLQPLIARCGGRVEVAGSGTSAISAREAGLGGLVLVNLAQNALEAGGPDARVLLTISTEAGAVCFDVADHGPGLPAEVLADPFRPRRSTKPDGAGIGLAISRELARHAGGELTLVRSGAQGTAFRLRLPAAAKRPTTENA